MISVKLIDVSIEFIPITNYPGKWNDFRPHHCSLRRETKSDIYLRGLHRKRRQYEHLECIWFIDLSSPPAFVRSNLTHGSYPHPTDCNSFFVCVDGELAGEFTCSSSQLFDPVQQTCTIPEEVVCFFTCDGREGLQPHPTDCSKYIFCREGTAAIEVFDCPEPLLFDPVLLKCDLPQFVNCSTVLSGF
jgi:hypothetical protein